MDGKAETNMTVYALKGKITTLPVVDKTLTKEGYAADAKKTGTEIEHLNNRMDNIDPHFAENVGYDNANSGLDADKVQQAIDLLHTLVTSGVVNNDFKIEKPSPAMRLVNTTTGRTGEAHYSNQSNLILANKLDDDNLVGIWIKPETEAPGDYLDLGVYINGEFTRYPIFGTYNRPKGKYQGNASDEVRTINIGGSGTTLKISTSNGMAIVTGAGAICLKSTGEVYGLSYVYISFNNGVLELATKDIIVNGARDIYYEVL